MGTLPKRDEIKVKKVTLKGNKVKIDLGNRVLIAKIKVEPHIENVGHWLGTHGKVIEIDNDIASNPKYEKSVALHEVVEEAEFRSLPSGIPSGERQHQAHIIATRIERTYFLKYLGNEKEWRNYSSKVSKIHKKEVGKK